MRTDLGRDRLQDRLDQRPGFLRAAGHDARTAPRTFFAARHARPDIQQPLLFQRLRASLGVLEVRVAAVHDHVARRQERNQLIDDRIDRRAGLDHQHHDARRLELLHQFGQRRAADDLPPARRAWPRTPASSSWCGSRPRRGSRGPPCSSTRFWPITFRPHSPMSQSVVMWLVSQGGVEGR